MILAATSVANIVAICAGCSVVSAGLVGLIFRGAAAAWKTERDAAVLRADRLEHKVSDQATEIATLKSQVDLLEKRTNYEVYAERSARDHQVILTALGEQGKLLHANTVAVEFLIKQAFPTAALTFAPPDGEPERSTA